jgi:hypothetical protein
MIREKYIKFRVSECERGKLLSHAREAGLSISEAMRRMICIGGARAWQQPVNRRTIAQIAWVGNNLNELSRWANTLKGKAETEKVIQALKVIEGEMRKIREALC